MATIVVAEIGQAHDGSLGTAHAYIDAVAKAGVDCVKFQTHIADAESHPSEPWRVHFSQQDSRRIDYWRRMQFTEPQWQGLYEHAAELGLVFISSPFSIEAVEMLIRSGIDKWKIASGELGHIPMLEKIAEDGRPVIISTGLSDLNEIESAISIFKENTKDLTLLQCASFYPCSPEQIGLNLISDLRDRFQLPVGLSDHSGTIFAGLAASALGATMVEVHVTFSRSAFGPDVSASLTIEELKLLVDGVRFIDQALEVVKDKSIVPAEVLHMRNLFTRSLVTRRRIKQGSTIVMQDLTLKKPGIGISYADVEKVVGRRALGDIEENHIVSLSDLESFE